MSNISKLPKVFGLGLSKTGTSSLSDALNYLEIPTIHYPFDDDTYQQLRGGDYNLKLLETYQGVVDIPLVPYYAQLDKIYPGSKFILTVRNLDSWLRSAEKHWELMMVWWENSPTFKRFHEFVSAAVYGTIYYNEDRFRYVYLQHEKNILEYFKNRPEDLLVIDICAGEGWDKLCAFLNKPVPDVPFPHANEWMHKLMEATTEFKKNVPEQSKVILWDEEAMGDEFWAGRIKIPFIEKDGRYWGMPHDEDEAIREYNRIADKADYLVISWPSFWSFDYYPNLFKQIRNQSQVLLENERLTIFKI